MYADELDDRQKKLLELLADGLDAGTVGSDWGLMSGDNYFLTNISAVSDPEINNFWKENATEADFRQFEEYGLMQQTDRNRWVLRPQRLKNFVRSGFRQLPSVAPGIHMYNTTFETTGNVAISIMGHITQTATTLNHGTPEQRQQLQTCLQELTALLEKVPSENQLLAEAVALNARDIVQELEREQPNKRYLAKTRDALLAEAKELAVRFPAVLSVAANLATVAHAISEAL